MHWKRKSFYDADKELNVGIFESEEKKKDFRLLLGLFYLFLHFSPCLQLL